MDRPSPPFDLIGRASGGPVIVSVPHAGRTYPPEHRAMLRPPVERLVALEDRLVDELAGDLDAPTLIARLPRAWIDINRHEAEIDPGLVEGTVASRLMLTPKVRSGLGLIPRRLAGIGEIWRGRLPLADVEARLAEVHRPYHALLGELLREATAMHGIAVLLDLHSMPPLPSRNREGTPQVVIGNRFGHSAAAWVTATIAAACARFGVGWRENSPYAGGHIVERHGLPASGMHAVQLELDRSLYLDRSLDGCDPDGLACCRRFLRAVVADLRAGAIERALPLAAD
jgi:N-formylglutamate amidohydrolase